MKPAAWLLLASLYLFMPGIALGGVDGHMLLQKCEPINTLYEDPASLSSKETSGVVYCLGYIDSFIETFYFQVKAKIVAALPYCLPEEKLSKKDTVKMIVEYLKKHPDELGKPAGYHLFMALREAYPCNKEDEKGIIENKVSSGQ